MRIVLPELCLQLVTVLAHTHRQLLQRGTLHDTHALLEGQSLGLRGSRNVLHKVRYQLVIKSHVGSFVGSHRVVVWCRKYGDDLCKKVNWVHMYIYICFARLPYCHAWTRVHWPCIHASVWHNWADDAQGSSQLCPDQTRRQHLAKYSACTPALSVGRSTLCRRSERQSEMIIDKFSIIIISLLITCCHSVLSNGSDSLRGGRKMETY